MTNTKADKGLTWAELGDHLAALREAWHVGTTVKIVPPMYVSLTGRSSCWIAVVAVYSLGEGARELKSAQVSWGYTGTCTTAPSAILLASTKLAVWLEEERLKAEAQSRI